MMSNTNVLSNEESALYADISAIINSDLLSNVRKASQIIAMVSTFANDQELRRLKQIWNTTQPDLLPEGWQPETPEAQCIQDRIEELLKEVNE